MSNLTLVYPHQSLVVYQEENGNSKMATQSFRIRFTN